MEKPVRTFRASLLASLAVLYIAGCSTATVREGDEDIEPAFTADRILQEDVLLAIEDPYDPWEGFNRTMYRFNYHFDRYVFLPAVRGYQAVLPDVAETGIHNFFNNFRDIRTLYNSILQAKGRKTLETTSRILWNSSVGLLGFVDVASHMDLPRQEEDFGQTLGRWGVGPGPYLVLPLLGPSSLRDGIGTGVDIFAMGLIRDQIIDLEIWQRVVWGVVDAIDTRANIPFRYFETGSAFEYEMVRMLWSTTRELEVQR